MLDYLNDELAVDNMQISPGYAYEKAPDQEHFLGVEETRRAVPQGVRRRAAGKKWRLNHSPLFLDFLEGKRRLRVHGVGRSRRTRCSAGSGRATCMADGYAETYQELLEETDWDSYGRGKDPRCANCMAHCGYEPTAVLATMGSLRESLRAVRER